MGRETFGATIRAWREERGLTLRAAARELQLSPAYLSRLERDQEQPTSDRIAQLAKLFGCSEDELYGLASQIAPDVASYVAQVSTLPAFLRTAQSQNLGAGDFEKFRRQLLKTKRPR